MYRRRTVYRVLAGRAQQLGLATLLAEGLRYYRRYPTLAPYNRCTACQPALPPHKPGPPLQLGENIC